MSQVCVLLTLSQMITVPPVVVVPGGGGVGFVGFGGGAGRAVAAAARLGVARSAIAATLPMVLASFIASLLFRSRKCPHSAFSDHHALGRCVESIHFPRIRWRILVQMHSQT